MKQYINKMDIAFLCETWLRDETEFPIEVLGYKLYKIIIIIIIFISYIAHFLVQYYSKRCTVKVVRY